MADKDAKKAKADPTTPEEKAVVFVNTEVLSPPTADPMLGAAKIMIDQSTGMMVQDLQSFLKGFEQVGLVALTKLANNYLTYGNYFPPPGMGGSGGSGGSTEKGEKGSVQGSEGVDGNAMMKDLFKIVSDYAETKTKLSDTIFKNNMTPYSSGIPNLPPLADFSEENEEEDPEKKNE